MRSMTIIVVAAVLAAFQHSWWDLSDPAPDLVLAFTMWLVVAGDAVRSQWRAWLVGTVHDLFDPGSVCFHALTALMFAGAYFPLRRFVFPRSMIGWALVAGTARILQLALDCLIGDVALPGIWFTFQAAVSTGAAAIWIGWLAEGLPKGMRPLAPGEGRMLE